MWNQRAAEWVPVCCCFEPDFERKGLLFDPKSIWKTSEDPRSILSKFWGQMGWIKVRKKARNPSSACGLWVKKLKTTDFDKFGYKLQEPHGMFWTGWSRKPQPKQASLTKYGLKKDLVSFDFSFGEEKVEIFEEFQQWKWRYALAIFGLSSRVEMATCWWEISLRKLFVDTRKRLERWVEVSTLNSCCWFA